MTVHTVIYSIYTETLHRTPKHNVTLHGSLHEAHNTPHTPQQFVTLHSTIQVARIGKPYRKSNRLSLLPYYLQLQKIYLEIYMETYEYHIVFAAQFQHGRSHLLHI